MADLSYPQHDKTQQWVQSIQEQSKTVATFDDSSDVWRSAPDNVLAVADAIGTKEQSGRSMVVAALQSGIACYEKQHGCKPSGAVLDSAIRVTLNSVSSSYAASATDNRVVFDNLVTGMQSNSPMVANRAAIVLNNAIGLAIPFAGYVPMGEGMKGQVIVAGHAAGNTVGDYVKNDSLDGLSAGRNFMSAERVVLAESTDQTNFTFKIKHAKDDAEGSPTMPSHTEVLINGIPYSAAAINTDVRASTVRLAGSAVLEDGKEYNFVGSLAVEKGNGNLTFTPPLPAGAQVHVVGMLNYEHESMANKRPRFLSTAQPYEFRAGFVSGLYQVSQEASAQFKAETRLDPASEAMFSMQMQDKIEQHFNGLKSNYRVAQSYKYSANLNGTTRLNDRSMAALWSDVLFKLKEADMAMVARTGAFGIKYLYVGAKGAAHISSLPNEIFEPSLSPVVAGIYRVGRLFGQYEVYHAPNIVNETSDSIEILAIGASEQTGMNTYIVGDVLPPVFKNLGLTESLLEGAAYFSCGASRINPYHKAAKGSALIAVTGLVL